ncbi:hypothetical protein F5Y15DRAFT_430813 [Xylariaceae sp. FL0016]|nr:hypothetical protein F5Y15DRAFT_430813 [Xylariaceae sp. FL0016]
MASSSSDRLDAAASNPDQFEPQEKLKESRRNSKGGNGVEDGAAQATDNGKGSGSTGSDGNTKEPASPAPKPGIMDKLGLDTPTLMMMFKGAIAPVIGLAISQSHAVAEEYTTLGYLVGIMCVLSVTITPRGKFIQTMTFNVLFACVGAAVSLLMLWSSLQARLHTQSHPQGTGTVPYNASQSAVSAVWLFANIWLVNTLRAKYPSLNLPSIVYSIVTNITCTYSPSMTSNAAFESLVKRLLTAILTAFGIATACSLLILPVSSRKVAKAQMKGAFMLLRGAMKQEKAYLQSLEREDMFAVPADISSGTTQEATSRAGQKKGAPDPNSVAEARAIKETLAKMRQLIGKIYADLPFSKRDIAWAKLKPKDLTHILDAFRAIVIPIVGMGTIVDIFQRIAEKRGWFVTADTPPETIAEKREEKRVWNEIMKHLHEPFEELATAIDEGLEHAGMLLEVLPRPKPNKSGKSRGTKTAPSDADIESKGDLVRPGDEGFYEALKLRMKNVRIVRSEIIQTWAREKGLLPDEYDFDEFNAVPFAQDGHKHSRDQAQLYILLYIGTLMQAAGQAVVRFVEYAELKVSDGTMSKNRLMIPKFKTCKKWICSIFDDEDKSQENSADLFDSGLDIVYMGDSFAEKKDPEHLPATSFWQRAGNLLRAFPRFLSSEESQFGFRAACATLTIGIAAFLEGTHIFFTEQRLVWAMIIIAIGMTQTSGQSIFGFVCRVLGTLCAMIFSLITWYIVDGKTPGILVFLYLFLAFEHYFFLKYPQFIPAIMICMVTQVLIIGYELQVRVLGIEAAEQTGQPVYRIYQLAPYRLACVAGGCLVAFFWTILPSPVTERTYLRRDLSATLYLLANYFSAINETLRARIADTGGDPAVKGTPAHRLAKHRRVLFGKLYLLLPALKQHADFQRWEPTVGGPFPRAVYQDIIASATRISSYLTLLAYTVGGSGTPSMDLSEDATNSGRCERAWLDALSVLMADISPTQNGIICTLTLLSNSLASGHSLPPHLSVPRPYELTKQLENISRAVAGQGQGKESDAKKGGSNKVKGLLDAHNISQAGYAEFAVLQVCSTLVCDDLEGLVASVSRLVGVVDFSYRVSPSPRASRGSLGDSSDATAVSTGVAASPDDSAGKRREKPAKYS